MFETKCASFIINNGFSYVLLTMVLDIDYIQLTMGLDEGYIQLYTAITMVLDIGY